MKLYLYIQEGCYSFWYNRLVSAQRFVPLRSLSGREIVDNSSFSNSCEEIIVREVEKEEKEKERKYLHFQAQSNS